jgi:hypothetical protein
MTRDAFLNWTVAQRTRYEFDGFAPVAMTGGSRDHSRICQNIYAALRSRLKGSGCEPLGPDAGIATTGNAVCYRMPWSPAPRDLDQTGSSPASSLFSKS